MRRCVRAGAARTRPCFLFSFPARGHGKEHAWLRNLVSGARHRRFGLTGLQVSRPSTIHRGSLHRVGERHCFCSTERCCLPCHSKHGQGICLLLYYLREMPHKCGRSTKREQFYFISRLHFPFPLLLMKHQKHTPVERWRRHNTGPCNYMFVNRCRARY
jgi:hypothetical protein